LKRVCGTRYKIRQYLPEDVKQVLTYVERGEVNAGVVYRTDARTAEPGIIKIVTNVSVSTPVKYPISVVSSTEHKEKAQKPLDFVTGKKDTIY
jgi:molybdate transport system substrate-binding protein